MIENLNDAPEWARKLGNALNELEDEVKTHTDKSKQEPPKKNDDPGACDEAMVSQVLDAIMPTGLTEDPGKEHRVDPAIKEIVNSIM